MGNKETLDFQIEKSGNASSMFDETVNKLIQQKRKLIDFSAKDRAQLQTMQMIKDTSFELFSNDVITEEELFENLEVILNSSSVKVGLKKFIAIEEYKADIKEGVKFAQRSREDAEYVSQKRMKNLQYLKR